MNFWDKILLILIQARMNSRRLPGKVLMDLEGKLLLEWTVERLSKNVSENTFCNYYFKSKEVII